MKRSTIPLLVCPACRGALTLSGDADDEIRTGIMTCPTCQKTYPIVDGIPHFIAPEGLTGFNRRFFAFRLFRPADDCPRPPRGSGIGGGVW